MIKILGLVICVFSVQCAISQVDELRRVQDSARSILNQNLSTTPNKSKTLYVDPFIGTGGHGHTYPGAAAPFGMMQLSPDTRFDGWDGCSGYHYSDSIIYGFSHTHLSGTGVSDYGDLLIVPESGKPKIDPGYAVERGYGSHFSHDTEEASPGFYKVHLDDNDIDVRLTVSERAGFHEYTFNDPKGKKFIVIDLDHRDKLLESHFTVIDKKTISGARSSHAWATNQQFFFHLELDVPYQKVRIFEKDGRHKMLLIFPKNTTQINIRVGMSAVDEDGARENLHSEIPDWNFDKTRAAVVRKWEKELSKIYFDPIDPEMNTTFYTALYHSNLAPNIFNDLDGRYRGRDGEIHQLPEGAGNQYTVFSLWDTYRASHPLFTLTQVERTNDFVNTFLRQYNEGGDLPVWELAGNETECMIGYHSVSVIADAFVKGIRGFDHDAAMDAMVATSNFDEYGKREFQEAGYINAGSEPESVSKSLEYAYDEFCISQMKNAILHMDQRTPMRNVSPIGHTMFNFINSFDPQTGFMRARRNGRWFSPFDPAEVNFNYTEANSWQYSLYAPHAVGVLRDLLGGPDSLEAWLDRLFTTEMELSGRHQVDITGLIGQYAHGNEPSHHMAYLYNYTNAPEKTQYYIDRILKEMYSNNPDGLSGNEDCGQMSSWYVLSALGIYQIAPGNPYYEIGRPLINHGKILFENGTELSILVDNNSMENKYVQEIVYNGYILNRSYLSHEELTAGGRIIIKMGATPATKRDKFSHAPTLSEIPSSFVALPYFEQTEHIFEDSMTLSMNLPVDNNCTINYTLDGSEPTSASPQYSEPFTISSTTTINARAINAHGSSATISNTFIKKDNGVHIELISEYSNQYAGGGDLALIDGIHGSTEFRTGDWQGYWAQPFEAVITFDTPRDITEVGLGLLSDMKSWIFYPRTVTFAYSYDGVTWEDGGITNIITEEVADDMYPHRMDVISEIEPKKSIKKIKVLAYNLDECPEWHLGVGNPTWLFVDEIYFK
ncbi:MAG: GH92 family glycosyl hydrolase [Crocinitomicaceae bacterium]|nr:GH92 family glycosyl hydrolase [Crocinitomicaceae bacterium]